MRACVRACVRVCVCVYCRVVATVRGSKSSGKIVVGAYGLDKDCALPKEKLKSVDERLCGPLRLSSMDRTVTQSSSRQERLTTVPV